MCGVELGGRANAMARRRGSWGTKARGGCQRWRIARRGHADPAGECPEQATPIDALARAGSGSKHSSSPPPIPFLHGHGGGGAGLGHRVQCSGARICALVAGSFLGSVPTAACRRSGGGINIGQGHHGRCPGGQVRHPQGRGQAAVVGHVPRGSWRRQSATASTCGSFTQVVESGPALRFARSERVAANATVRLLCLARASMPLGKGFYRAAGQRQ